MNNILRETGIIQYDPFRRGMKHRTDWWCVLNINTELTRYYRWWLKFEKHLHLQPPSWDAHISLIRGEKPRGEHLNNWKKFQGEKVEFFYEHGNIQIDRSQRTDDRAVHNVGGEFYFINVECPRLDEIRKELGLKTGFTYHFTVARSYEYCSRHENRKNHQSGKK